MITDGRIGCGQDAWELEEGDEGRELFIRLTCESLPKM